MEIVIHVLRLLSIMLAINLKTSREKNTLRVYFLLSTWLVSPLGIYGTLLPPLMLLTSTAKKKTLLAWNCRLY